VQAAMAAEIDNVINLARNFIFGSLDLSIAPTKI
jgi:hypothetical protein